MEIISFVISLCFFSFASMCNAVMDTLQFHYHRSIFYINPKFDENFYNPELSWRNKYKFKTNPSFGIRTIIDWTLCTFKNGRKIVIRIEYPTALTCAWHFYKSAMIFLIVFSVVTFRVIEIPNIPIWMIILGSIGMYGFAWNFTFHKYFNQFLLKKTRIK